jgi:hypothetical protein
MVPLLLLTFASLVPKTTGYVITIDEFLVSDDVLNGVLDGHFNDKP